jgi:transposase
MSQKLDSAIAGIGIDIGKNSFHVVGPDKRGAIVLRQKWSRDQVEARLANVPPCLIGMEACVGAHHLSRKLQALGHDARLMPAKYVRPYSKGQKNDFRDAEAITEAVQRPTMKFVTTKTADQLDLQALHRVRERLVGQRTGIINQMRAFLLERGVAVRKGPRFLRAELPAIVAKRTDVLSPRMLHLIEGLAEDWRRLDERIETLSNEINALARTDSACDRLMSVPGIGPIIASAMVAAIGTGEAFAKGRDFGAWLGLVPKQISTGDRTILGSISKRGNRYLRALFVQAARVVLARIRPKQWERYGLKSWIEAAQRRLHPCWRLRSPTSSPASPGRFSTKGAPSSARRPMQWRPELPDARAVLRPSRRGLAKLQQTTSSPRRPALTAPARGAPVRPQAGTKERSQRANKGTAGSKEDY